MTDQSRTSRRRAQADMHPASLVQARAAHPGRSVWVGASAGTGKTKVLVDRLLRLMLPRLAEDGTAVAGTPPGRILCLTFTKTGAAEMANRVAGVLAEWSVLEEPRLRQSLAALTGNDPTPDVLAAARRLFAQVLDTPGGLKIMTIHSFCQSVLKRFPVEAGVAPHFVPLDERAALDLLTSCLHALIADTRLDPVSPLARAFRLLSLRLNAEDMTQELCKLMSLRARLGAIFAQHGDSGRSAEKTVEALFQGLGLARSLRVADIEADMANGMTHAQDDLRALTRAMDEHGTEGGRETARLLADFLAAGHDARLANLDGYLSVFLTKDEQPRKKIVTKNVQAALPTATDIAAQEATRLEALCIRRKTLRLAEGTAALLTVAADMLGRYEAAKTQRDALDFDDLILRAADLLGSDKGAAWVLYKLDEGLDHILVDEAQDTSPAQWRVIAALAEEFFGGESARGQVTRTLFVVGDEKQSIFSFHGADPAAFDQMRTHFAGRAAALQEGFALDLAYSFRSTASVLQVVDGVFGAAQVKAGVVADVSKPVVHLPFRVGDAGQVDLWPLLAPIPETAEEGWRSPSAVSASGDTPPARLARQIAETIHGFLTRGEVLPSKGRPIRAGDVLILVQSRQGLVELLMRALKSFNIPVAGADRMQLGQEIAVMDLVALARFALQPRDDLMLAALLKSPLIGVDEDALFALCHGRDGKTLWARLHDLRPDLVAWLQPFVATAGRATPYEFFAGALGGPCPGDSVSGRRAFYGRLGRDVSDALDEFLSASLSYEQSHAPALEAFVDWFARGDSDIKRDQEGADIDQVRIMTVHASKGLQAPIVFLPDTVKMNYMQPRAREKLVWPESGDPLPLPLWAASKSEATDLYSARQAALRQRQDNEYRRLLYVAMTRAEDRLYVCGFTGKKAVQEGCWYKVVEAFFADTPADEFGVRTIGHPQQKPVSVQAAASVMRPSAPRPALPEWARQMAPAETVLARPLAPSKPGEDEPAVKSPLATDDSGRFARGVILHRLLEALPSLPREKWDAALAAFLSRPAFGLTAATQRAFASEVMVVLTHPDFADIFGTDARAEVPLTGIIGAGDAARVVSGQVDRLLVRDDAVLVVDYKTNRPPPDDPADIPVVYLKQMAAYRDLLSQIYPDRVVKCALLWTDAVRLMPIPESRLAPYALSCHE